MNARNGRTPTDRSGERRALRLHRAGLAAALLTLLAFCCLFVGTASARAAAAPGKPTAKAPKGTAASATPTFTWGKAKGAKTYEVRVYQGSKQLLKKARITTLSWTSSKALTSNVALTWKVRASSGKRSGAWSKTLSFKIVVLKIGDAYQGGKVAYILQPTDPGYVAGETHGLIAAMGDSSSMGIRWSTGSIATTGATGTAVGTGSANTAAIIATQGAPETSYAAGLAKAFNGGGYHDWYLPSRDELNQLYVNRAALGGTWSARDYWSSTELSPLGAYLQDFTNGHISADVKTDLQGVRAVRSF
jgi:hypothetical protein